MTLSPEVVLSCVHLYSMIGDRKKSLYYDKLFVHMMKHSIETSQLDNRDALE
ncbi:MAG TPA: hypothetical protein VM123_06655 [archaeon]|nr:hypothetical protein [archaeon]